MSTNKRASDDDRGQKKGSGKSSTGKKPKSKGFIETSGYKPNWLETGPLSPDMLEPGSQDAEMTQDEFDALQTSLQRFYREERGEDVDEFSPDGLETAEADRPEVAETTSSADPAGETAKSDPIMETYAFDDDSRAAEPVEVESEQDADAWYMDIPQVGAAAVGTAAVYPAEPMAPDTPAQDEFIVHEEASEFEEPTAVASPALPQTAAKPKREKKPKTRKRRDRISVSLLLASLILLALAAFVYFVNPFSRIALGAASLARPATSSAAPSPSDASGAWCVQGDFLDGGAPLPLIDTGAGGDILAEDRVFSLEHPISQPGTYEWQVVDCDNSSLSFPAQSAWIRITEANQPVIFTFDSNERSDPLFFPIPFVVSAEDNTTDFRVVGDFQEWNPDDPNSHMQRVNIGLYQQVRKIARAGDYEAYVIAGGDNNQAVDAYGRTTEPIPFAFQTERNSDYVVFLLDTDRGRASVAYDMPPVLTRLAYGNGYWVLSLALAGLALLLLAALLLRWLILHNRGLQLESGCPHCGRQELMRISRRSGDRLLHAFGIPAYRYRCRNCTWEGTRLSETGAAISPGAAIVGFDDR